MNKFFKATLTIGLLASSAFSQASILTDTYILDETTSVITAGNLQWLQWSVTADADPFQYLDEYKAQGWTLANAQQMQTLFDDAGLVDVSATVKNRQRGDALTTGQQAPANIISLFGVMPVTFMQSIVATTGSAYKNGDGFFHASFIEESYVSLKHLGQYPDVHIAATADVSTGPGGVPSQGLALVRSLQVQDVPEAPTAALSALGLLLLGARKRKAFKH